MPTARLRRNITKLKRLAKTNSVEARTRIIVDDSDLLDCLLDVIKNLVEGRLPIPDKYKRIVQKYKTYYRHCAKKYPKNKNHCRRLLQEDSANVPTLAKLVVNYLYTK
jgi:hypothetical protein